MSKEDNRDTYESRRAKMLCGNKCILCGWPYKTMQIEDSSKLVEGAHIKEFKKDVDADVAKNIIALCPNHHTEFDHNYFYIDLDYTVTYYDPTIKENGLKLNIEYVEKKYLQDKKNTVLSYWKKLGLKSEEN